MQEPEEWGGAAQTNNGSGTSSTQDLKDQAARDLGAIADTARRNVDAVVAEAGDELSHLRSEVGSQLGTLMDHAKSVANEQKDLAATQLSGVADALDRIAGDLGQGEQAVPARYATEASRQMRRLAETVQQNNIEQLIGKAESFGRSQPALFIGLAALAGFAASRFLMASAAHAASEAEPRLTGFDSANETIGRGSPYAGNGAAMSDGGGAYGAEGDF